MSPTAARQRSDALRLGKADLHDWNLRFAERLGPDWVAVDPWPIDVKTEAGTKQLRAWARAAYDYAGAF